MDSATTTKELLRATIHEFLRHEGEVPENKDKQQRYWQEYWESRLFGLGDGARPASHT